MLVYCHHCLRLCLLVLAFVSVLVQSATDDKNSNNNNKNDSDEHGIVTWQSCDIFMAPTKLGLGVFAARPISKGEIFDFSPLFVGIYRRTQIVANTILKDYYFGVGKDDSVSADAGRVFFGLGSYYNHNPSPNVRKGTSTNPEITGFVAMRDIAMGEEIYINYDSKDGGIAWFERRGLEMEIPDRSKIGPKKIESYKDKFCSKVYAGPGLSTIDDIKNLDIHSGWLNYARLPPFDAGLGNARAKTDIEPGERIEFGIGMVVPRKLVFRTSLEPLAIHFDNLDEESQQSLRSLRKAGNLTVTYIQLDDTRVDDFSGFDELSIVPLGGNIAMIRRVGHEDPSSNCRLHISKKASIMGSSGIKLNLVATKSIAAGDVLKVSMDPTESDVGYRWLKQELDDQGGQPYWTPFFPDDHEEL